MLINFSVENWMSFRNKATFSMLATRERQHSERLPALAQYKTRLLPIAALYGGNASGKTGLCRALSFAKKFVVEGTKTDEYIPVKPFRLDDKTENRPSRFDFEILCSGTIYVFHFSATRDEVLEESLYEVINGKNKLCYKRENGNITLNASLSNQDFLKFAFQGTRANQLFLTNAISQNVNTFKPVYDWFSHSLQVVLSDRSNFGPFNRLYGEISPLYSLLNRLLSEFDTGIARVGIEEVSLDKAPIPIEIKKHISEEFAEDRSQHYSPANARFEITWQNGRPLLEKLITYHPGKDGSEIKFEFSEESDGSKRLIDLLPFLLALSHSPSEIVFVIDELDRSLHALLVEKLVRMYLAHCTPDSRSQLLFTTHNVLLMDQDIFRRDELWVTERDAAGASTLLSFSDYKNVRYDKDIRKSYLQGRLGGIPRILLSSMPLPETANQKEAD